MGRKVSARGGDGQDRNEKERVGASSEEGKDKRREGDRGEC